MPFTYKQQFQEENAKKLIAYILRKERIKQGLSVRSLAENAGMTPQFLSDIEHCKKSPSDYAFRQLQKALGVRFYVNDTYYQETKEICHAIFEAYAALDKETIIQLFHKYEKNIEIYTHSSGLAYYLLSKIIYYFYAKTQFEDIHDDLKELESIHFSLEDNDIVKLYDLYGHKYLIEGNNEAAGYYFLKALESTSSTFILENVVLYSHLTTFYRITNEFWKAIDACNTSLSLSAELCIFSRIVHNQIKKANIYVVMKFYNKASELYRHLINKVPTTPIQKSLLYDNLAFCQLQLKEYDIALDCCQKAQSFGSSFSAIYLYFIYIYWKQNRYNECLSYFYKNIHNENICEIDKALISSIVSHIQGDKSEVYKYLDIALAKPEKDNNYKAMDTILFTLDIAIELYKSYKDYERVIALYEEKDRLQIKE